MKKFVLAVVGMMAALGSFAYETWTDPSTGIEWTYEVREDGSVSLGGGGYQYPAILKSTSGALAIPALINGKRVTSIGDGAFSHCSALTSVTIPASVTSIGDDAFRRCSRLRSVSIPSSVTSIGKYAFGDCSRLGSVTIPSSVMSIAECAFSGCITLTSINVENANADYKSVAGVLFSKDMTCLKAFPGGKTGEYAIPSGVTRIDREAFYGSSGLTSVTIPSGVTSVGSGAFCGCSGLRSVTIPPTVTSVGSGAFIGCSGLRSVTIPPTVPSIGTSAFRGCSGLTSVTIPAGVTSIGAYAFSGCDSLTSVTIPASVTSIEICSFSECSTLASINVENANADCKSVAGVLFTKDMTRLKAFPGGKMGDYTIPSGVTSVEAGAFRGCHGLTSVTIPASVTDIWMSGFSECSTLTSINVENANADYKSVAGVLFTKDMTCLKAFPGGKTGEYKIPSGVTSIGAYAFSGCDSLTSVTIPASVTSIADGAFSECSTLTSINVENANADYKSVAGVLFTKDMTGLIAFPGGKTGDYTIPSGVTSVEAGAFGGCHGLTSVTIPASVTRIGLSVGLTLKTVYVDEGDESRIRSLLEESGFDTDDVAFKVKGSLSATFIFGAKSTEDVGLVGYKASGLPSGLSYDAKKGTISGTAKAVGEYEVTFTKAGEADVVVTIVVRMENEPAIDCPVLDLNDGAFTAGVVGAEGGIPLNLDAESGVKSLSMKGQPSGWKLVQDKTTKEWTIQGAATKTGTFNVTLMLTTAAGTKVEKKYAITVSAPHEMAIGTYNGFLMKNGDNVGTFQLTTTEAGKITAKIVNVKGTYSFSGTAWDSASGNMYAVALKSSKKDSLQLYLYTDQGWNGYHVAGFFRSADGDEAEVSAQRNAFGKQWYFLAKGDETDGWTFSSADNAKAANLTVTLNADGKTSIAGSLVGRFATLKVSASGYCDVSGLADGGIIADFAPVMTVNKEKKVLSIRTNLWFDRTNDHDLIGSAKLVE